MSKPRHIGKKYTVTRMWDVHHEIVRLAAVGMTHQEISERLGVSLPMVTYTLESPICQTKLEILRLERDRKAVDIAAKISEAADDSFSFINDVARGTVREANTSHRLKAALEILDRAGYSKVQKNMNLNLDGKLTPGEIDEISRRASARSAHGVVVETQESAR